MTQDDLHPNFSRSNVVLKLDANVDARTVILNPACARITDGSLQLYPRMVAPGNVSRIGSFRAQEVSGGTVEFEFRGYALEPQAEYELRSEPGGYGCEDPRVTFVPALACYVMLYVAYGPRGPEVAVAVSQDGLAWRRIGLLCFKGRPESCADKDAALFPEPVTSPAGVESLAFYHRPTLRISVLGGESAIAAIEALPPSRREGIAIGYIPLAPAIADVSALCHVAETHRLSLPGANWGSIKVGAGTPPVRIAQGWLSVIHGVDALPHPSGNTLLRYCAGVIVHDPSHLDRILYRSRDPLFVPELPAELEGTLGDVVFPTGIDRRSETAFDIYYGMADDAIGAGRLNLASA
ncbi:MAG: glycosidase [Candidatus Eremiobacteraeota bacterium]|nr:glycosidase [Candidatus Eremiobacteraeota bacterium]